VETQSELIFQLLNSLLIGAIIGAEREYRTKSAGLRTLILISLGATIFTLLSKLISPENPDRIAANIVTGIGFLGAGVIFKEESRVTGITTAATIWATAALGMAIANQNWLIVYAGTAIVLFVLIALPYLQDWIDILNKTKNYRFVFTNDNTMLEKIKTEFALHNLHADEGSFSRVGEKLSASWDARGAERNHVAFVNAILNNPEVQEFYF
jgi:putative Mg2+ transporter-C (MgtC) family protein